MSKLRVNGKIYKVVTAHFKWRDIRGSIDYARREITIGKGLFGYVKDETLLHEIQHACHEGLGIMSSDIMTAEQFISKTNATLFRTLYENGYWRKPITCVIARVLAVIVVATVAWIALPNDLCVSNTGNIYAQSTNEACSFAGDKNIVEALILRNLLVL